MNKRGSMFDIIFIVVVVAILTTTVIYGSFIWEKINTGIEPSMDAQSFTTVENMRTRVTSAFDYMVPIIVVFTGLGIVILAKFVNAHPMWYVFALILVIFGIFLAVIWQDILVNMLQTNAEVDAVYNNFPITKWFVENLHFIVLGFGTIAMIVMYITKRAESGI